MAKQNYLFHSILLLHSFYYVTSSPTPNIKDEEKLTAEYNEINNGTDSLTSYHNVEFNAPKPPLHTDNKDRVKRAIDSNQGSSWLKYVWRERKYKIPQMFLTNIRNIWAIDPAGGRHPFEAGVPYGSMYLFKTLVLDSMFPRIGKNQ